MTKIITLYNHKGGVSKTTTTFNLAHALAERHSAKVLVVDADPQCNLTELCLAQLIDKIDSQDAAGDTITPLPGTTILDALKPRFDGDRPDVDIDSIELVTPEQAPEVSLLRGDITLNEAEDRLSQAHNARMTTEIHQRRNYIALYDMLRRLGDRKGFDFILIDVGPSAGALTRSCFLSCDIFLVPLAPDRFNFQAINSLSKITSRWIFEHRQIVRSFRDLNLNVSEGAPQFRGLIIQRYQRYGGEPKAAFKHWMNQIPKRTMEELLPSLQKSAPDKETVPSRFLTKPTIAEIPDFGSLAPMMLTHGKPVWRLTQADTKWSGSVWDERSQTMTMLKKIFFAIADAVGA